MESVQGWCHCKAIWGENTTLRSSPWKAVLPLPHGVDYIWPNRLFFSEDLWFDLFSGILFPNNSLASTLKQIYTARRKGMLSHKPFSHGPYTLSNQLPVHTAVHFRTWKIWTVVDINQMIWSWPNISYPLLNVPTEPKVNCWFCSCCNTMFRKLLGCL